MHEMFHSEYECKVLYKIKKKQCGVVQSRRWIVFHGTDCSSDTSIKDEALSTHNCKNLGRIQLIIWSSPDEQKGVCFQLLGSTFVQASDSSVFVSSHLGITAVVFILLHELVIELLEACHDSRHVFLCWQDGCS